MADVKKIDDEKKRKLQKKCDEKVYRFNILLPNGINIPFIKRNPVNESISFDNFVEKIKEKSLVVLKQTESTNNRRKIFWKSKDLYLEDFRGNKIRSQISYDKFKPNKTHFLRLFDGAGQTVETFENMWDLTPDTDLLTELPDDYTFETALADLIDNSLQAVWSNNKDERKLISVEIDGDEVSVFDTGPGMDGSDENSIAKWGKMGASANRSSKKLAIGGKPPYLTPFFGMFGYGGTIASMHLGRRAVVYAKTKESKKVYWLCLERDALLKRSGSDHSWKAAGGIRDPSDSETEMSPHGSFTKIVMKPKLELPDIFQLQCKVKDIYFPYIQCDEISKTGKTTTLVDFQINGTNLAEIGGGEVAVTNLHSCNGPDFVLNLHFSVEEDKAASKSPGVKAAREGNARLKCVYFPIIEGKESIENILEKLNADGYDIKEDFESYSRISIRRLGRLLPEARWELLPFMKPKQKRGAKLQILKKCCSRVKCFIDTDAGFNPIPSKTDLAPQHPFTKALKDLGGDNNQKEKGVQVQISKDGKQMTVQQLERLFQDWIFLMHSQYDDEGNFGDDEPVLLVTASNKDTLGVTSDVVRVHQVMSRKGKSWKRGQKVKVLKGACPGIYKNNMFATLEYFLFEGFERETGGDAWIICRPLAVVEADGSVLTINDTSSSLQLNSSISLSMIAIDAGKCIAVSENEWNLQADKKLPSMIEVLGPKQCKALNINGVLPPTDASLSAGSSPPRELGAVLRPATFIPSGTTDDLDQKYIIRGDYEMCLDVKFEAEAGKCSKMDPIFSATVTNTSRSGCPGLYIFSVGSIPRFYQKAGTYSFSFYLKDSATVICEKSVRVKASSNIKRWELLNDDQNLLSVSAGSCFPSFSIARYDEFDNIIPFESIPKIILQLMSNNDVLSQIKDIKLKLSSNQHHMVVENVRITSGKLDNIRPSYEATLALSLRDKQQFHHIPCLVFPGPIQFVRLHPSESVNGLLLPMQVIEDIQLEMLDKYRNHIKQGTEVDLEVCGFCFLDHIGLKRKVDDKGFLDLSGLLKVTGGYGQPVSLVVKYDSKVIFTKIFQVEKRELRVTKVPEICRVGSKLKDISFEVVDSEGNIDHAIHDDDKHGRSHTLKIASDLPESDSLRYAFRQGCCTIPSITLPQREGTFSIEAFHSHHRELHVKFEVNVSKSAHKEDTMSDTTSHLQASEDQGDDDIQSLDERLSHDSVSDAADNVITTEDEFAILSPLKIPTVEHAISTPMIPNKKFLLASGNVSTLAESKFAEQQVTLAETPCKLSDPNYEHNNDLFKFPEGQITLLGSDECANLSPLKTSTMEHVISTPAILDEKFLLATGNLSTLAESKLQEHQITLAQTPQKLSDISFEHDNDLYKSPEGKIIFLGSDLQDLEKIEKEIQEIGSCIKDQEEDLKWSLLRRDELKEDLAQLEAAIEVLPLPISQLDCRSQKEDVLDTIESRDSPAAAYSIASRNNSLKDRHPEFSADVIGVVALLATAPTPVLSRSLAEFLGEDNMLGIVCQSSAALTSPETYEYALNALAGELGKTIRGRQLIICLEDTRPYAGETFEIGDQRKLALSKPALPDGTTPPGFLGYAVNMIDIAPDYTQVKTVAGHGLRETLFYQLFGKLQVYETKEQLKHARGCITNGAVSLDGGIIQGRGIISLGSKQVDVLFPVEVPEFSGREQIEKDIEKNKSELTMVEEAIAYISEERLSWLKTFREKEAGFRKSLEESQQKLILSQQPLKLTPMTPTRSVIIELEKMMYIDCTA